jgi:hypothetical protein
MYASVTIRDEAIHGAFGDQYVFKLNLTTHHLSVRELLRTRVQKEVAEYNARQTENPALAYFRGLVQPSEAEQTLNGFKLRQPRQLDWQTQFDRAVQAFERNGFLILVDDRQVEDLDEMLELKPQTTVTFLKLVMLVGG